MKRLFLTLFIATLALTLSQQVPANGDGGYGQQEQVHEHMKSDVDDALSIQAEIVKTPLLAKGRKTAVTIKLTHDDGHPVLLDDLKIAHTEPIHLLIVEPQLTDYHHEHPVKTDVSGEYVFSITPQTNCTYRIWADLLPVGGSQQYVPLDLQGAENCTAPPEQTINYEASSNGYDFKLKLDGDLTNGKAVLTELTITKDDRPVDFLEPVMGAFAHMVGFYEDYRSIAHIHPMGQEPTKDTERGGPVLRFHIKPEQAGYLKLFAQVQIDGEQVFAPFGMDVKTSAQSVSGHGNNNHSH